MGKQPSSDDQHRENVEAAALVQPFPWIKHNTDADYIRSINEADLLSLHVCEGSHKMFVNESPAERIEGLVDAQSAAECVVELQSALREIPSIHPAYLDIRTELIWWNNKLLELDPADYRRLNSSNTTHF